MLISDKAVLKEWVKALTEISIFVKGQDNPLYNSKYTDLATIVQSIDPILAKHGFKVVQEVVSNGEEIGVVTTAMHMSGETITANPLFAKPAPSRSGIITPHAIGSTITYLRRYTLMAFVGQASKDDDDDGNAGSAKTVNVLEFYSNKIKSAKNMEELTEIWKEISKDENVQTSEVKSLTDLIKKIKVEFKKVNPDEIS